MNQNPASDHSATPSWPLLCATALALSAPPHSLHAQTIPNHVRHDPVVSAVEKAMPSVVNVATETIADARDPLDTLFREFFGPYYRRRPPNTQYSLGSGVIIDEDGFVLTNYHVVARAGRIRIRLADGREFEADRIVGASLTDLALLKLRAPEGEKFTAIPFAADDDLLLGETVLALGNPFGLGGSVSRGILSSKSRRPPREDEPLDVLDWLQTDAAINPGNSGGPLVNLQANLIGINVAVYREGQGIGFAIPIKRVLAALAEIYSPEVLESLWFGARIQPGQIPLRVLSVEPDSPAAKAGLRPDDLILKVNNHEPRGFIQFNRELLQHKDKEDVALTVQQDGYRRSLKVRLVPEASYFNEELIRQKTGASLQTTTPALARQLGLPAHQGLVVAGVDPDSPSAGAGLEPGMLITALDGQSPSDVVDAARLLHRKPKEGKVKLSLVVPRRLGAFIEYREVTVELPLR